MTGRNCIVTTDKEIPVLPTFEYLRGDVKDVIAPQKPCAGSPGNGQTPVEFKHQTWRTSDDGICKKSYIPSWGSAPNPEVFKASAALECRRKTGEPGQTCSAHRTWFPSKRLSVTASGYPSAGYSSAEPASVSPDSHTLHRVRLPVKHNASLGDSTFASPAPPQA
jgi:hypothetical protein